jgi:hypothetical protein
VVVVALSNGKVSMDSSISNSTDSIITINSNRSNGNSNRSSRVDITNSNRIIKEDTTTNSNTHHSSNSTEGITSTSKVDSGILKTWARVDHHHNNNNATHRMEEDSPSAKALIFDLTRHQVHLSDQDSLYPLELTQM